MSSGGSEGEQAPEPRVRDRWFPPEEVRLPSGEEIRIRLLRHDDGERLARYLEGQSPETRSYYRPHPYDRPTAEAICAGLAGAEEVRVVAVASDGAGEERILAYVPFLVGVREADRARYAGHGFALRPETDTTVAPSVADAYQGTGLASALMRYLMKCSRRLGRTRMVLWGGVQARNVRAIAFYRKWGFREMGEFETDQTNRDMLLEFGTEL